MSQDSNRSHHRQPPYAAFLVRMWQQTPDAPWCASAQSVQDGEVVRFSSVQALFAFLEAQTSDAAPIQMSAHSTAVHDGE